MTHKRLNKQQRMPRQLGLMQKLLLLKTPKIPLPKLLRSLTIPMPRGILQIRLIHFKPKSRPRMLDLHPLLSAFWRLRLKMANAFSCCQRSMNWVSLLLSRTMLTDWRNKRLSGLMRRQKILPRVRNHPTVMQLRLLMSTRLKPLERPRRQSLISRHILLITLSHHGRLRMTHLHTMLNFPKRTNKQWLNTILITSNLKKVRLKPSLWLTLPIRPSTRSTSKLWRQIQTLPNNSSNQLPRVQMRRRKEA